jgi:predicted transcriptional regulator
MKKKINIRFDEDLWKRVQKAGKQTKRSATAYLELSAEEQIKRDLKDKNITLDE